MKTYIAVTTLIALLAASAAFAEDRAATPTGIGKIAPYGYAADDEIQATWATQYPSDQQTLSPLLTSITPSAGVVLIASRGGGSTHKGIGSMHRGMGSTHKGISPMHRGMGSTHKGISPRHGHGSFRDHSNKFPHHGFYSRPFGRHNFHGRSYFHGGLGYYPYRGYGYYPYAYNYPYTYSYPYAYSYPYGYYYGNPLQFYPYFYFSW